MHAHMDPPRRLAYSQDWVVRLTFANRLPNTLEGKNPYNIMVNINVIRYASILIIMRKYSDVYDKKKKKKCMRSS